MTARKRAKPVVKADRPNNWTYSNPALRDNPAAIFDAQAKREARRLRNIRNQVHLGRSRIHAP